MAPGQEVRVLIATDLLSEGQNLQDAFIVVNYDLPWAVIRLVQRAGRVDRIGQCSSMKQGPRVLWKDERRSGVTRQKKLRPHV